MAHNEPVESAQKITGVATARQLLAAVKLGADSLGLHGEVDAERASYSDAFVFTVTAKKGYKAGGTETTSEVKVPGYVSNGHTSERTERTFDGRKVVDYAGVHRPARGFWFLTYLRDRLLDVLELLPSDAEVSFHVYLDAGTNEYLVRADSPMNFGTERGLHSDHLYLEAHYTQRGKKVTRRYLIDTATGGHNTARFGVGR